MSVDHPERCKLCGSRGITGRLPVFSSNFMDLVGCHPGTDPLQVGQADGTIEISNEQGLLECLFVEGVCRRCSDGVRDNLDRVAHPVLADISARFDRVATAFDAECIARWSLKTALLAASAYPQDAAAAVCGHVGDLLNGRAMPPGTVIFATGMRVGEVAKVQFRALCAIDPELPTEVHGIIGIIGLQNMTIFIIYGADADITDGILKFFEKISVAVSCARLWPLEATELKLPLYPQASALDIAQMYQSFGAVGEVYMASDNA